MKDAAKFARTLSPREQSLFLEAEEHRLKARLATLNLTDQSNEKERRRLKRELGVISDLRIEIWGRAMVEIAAKRNGRREV